MPKPANNEIFALTSPWLTNPQYCLSVQCACSPFSFVHTILLSAYADNWPEPNTLHSVLSFHCTHDITCSSKYSHLTVKGLLFLCVCLICDPSEVVQFLCVFFIKHGLNLAYVSQGCSRCCLWQISPRIHHIFVSFMSFSHVYTTSSAFSQQS